MREYKAPTPGLEKELFAVGTEGDAADFEEVQKKLARYARVNFKQGAAMAQKAVKGMVAPSFINPPDLSGMASPVDIKKWRIKYNELQSKKEAWKEHPTSTCILPLEYGTKACCIGQIQPNKSGPGPSRAAETDQEYHP